MPLSVEYASITLRSAANALLGNGRSCCYEKLYRVRFARVQNSRQLRLEMSLLIRIDFRLHIGQLGLGSAVSNLLRNVVKNDMPYNNGGQIILGDHVIGFAFRGRMIVPSSVASVQSRLTLFRIRKNERRFSA